MSLGAILLIILILVLVGALPTWGHSRTWGYGPACCMDAGECRKESGPFQPSGSRRHAAQIQRQPPAIILRGRNDG